MAAATKATASGARRVLLLLVVMHGALCASIFDVFGSSVTSLVTSQEEVPYTLLSKEQGYEVRRYPSQKWVCKLHVGSLTSAAQQTAFLALFDYLGGRNNHSAVMEMSIPASVEAPGSSSGTTFEACFYPGRRKQEDPPHPTNRHLYVKERPDMVVFTRQFGGYADTEAEWRAETDALAEALREEGQLLLMDRVYWNAYDSPIKFWARRNEVWILAKD